MSFIPPAERARIREAVEAAEATTSAELVAVVARRADGYLYVPLLVAAVAALLAAGIALLVEPALPAHLLYAGQVALFAVLSLVLRIPRLLMACVPRPIKRRRARRMAREVFIDLGLLNTQARTGVLFFVAAGEHHVEIVADRGVAAVIDDAAWQAVVDRFVADVKRGAVGEGFVAAIAACGELLARRLPAGPGDRNELRDRLIEL